jgi:hypothetical protein
MWNSNTSLGGLGVGIEVGNESDLPHLASGVQ